MTSRLALAALLAFFLAAAPAVRAGWKDLLKKGAESLDKNREKKRAKSRKKRSKAAAAVRGIGCGESEVDAAARDEEARDFKALDMMLESVPSQDDVDAFIEEGELS